LPELAAVNASGALLEAAQRSAAATHLLSHEVLQSMAPQGVGTSRLHLEAQTGKSAADQTVAAAVARALGARLGAAEAFVTVGRVGPTASRRSAGGY
jgi:hypothetical protein